MPTYRVGDSKARWFGMSQPSGLWKSSHQASQMQKCLDTRDRLRKKLKERTKSREDF